MGKNNAIRFIISIISLPLAIYSWGRGEIIHHRMIGEKGTEYIETITIHDGLGRPVQTIDNGANTGSIPVVTVLEPSPNGNPHIEWLPFASQGVTGRLDKTGVRNMSSTFHSDNHAFSESTYDALDRKTFATTSGEAWHKASKGISIRYSTNTASSVRLYSADVNGKALYEDGFWPPCTLTSTTETDEDGQTIEVFSDFEGRKILERRAGEYDTYYVYNNAGQLRFVLSPGYELSGYKDEFAYEYRYDDRGNIVKKFIPGGDYIQYWYDRSDQLIFFQDANNRGKGLYRFFLYDKFGRNVIRGISSDCNRNEAVNTATYTGNTSGFKETGYTLMDESRIRQATLETVCYYDDYSFVDRLDSRLSGNSQYSARGMNTGSIVYDSEGGRSMSAMYYDRKGNIIQHKEITRFGTLVTTDNTFSFSNQILTSKMTDSCGVTVLTENTYDAKCDLLLRADVTINGTKQTISSFTYDDLGRVSSIVKGNGNRPVGSIGYTYNLHGQVSSITGPGFSQKLYYADGPFDKLYNGNISSMTWTMGSDPTVRGYKYSYNDCNWLTLAEYGEGSSLTDHKNRYTEKCSEFMPNGGVRRLQRHGLKADGEYGKIDNLHIYYTGNRITSILEDAKPVTRPGSMDYPGKQREMSFGYNEWGALVKDESRGITDIEYDNNGNPYIITYSDGSCSKNIYSANGDKLISELCTDLSAGINPLTLIENEECLDISSYGISGNIRTEYRGPIIYRNGKIEMIRFPGGYATISGNNVTFHHYVCDYLGNNRAVINGSNGQIEQNTAYYPFGGVIADLGSGNSGQPFKFEGKELLDDNGLNVYDLGARLYYPAITQFDRIDGLSEKYYWLSPYIYCANNPVNAIDPDGKLVIFINGFYVTPTEGGDKSYWRSYKNWNFSFSAYPVRYRREKIYEFDIDVMRHLNDTKAKYVDGSLGGAIGVLGKNMSTAAEVRRQNGETIGLIDAPSIIASLNRDQDGSITEHIKVITHSMGSAYAKGYISSILKYADDNSIEGVIIDFEADFAPYNTQNQEAINHSNMGPTYQFSHSKDKIAGNKNISGAQMMDTSSDANQAHSIGSFVPQIQNIPVNIHTPKKK